MNLRLKLAILQTGRRQWEIAREVGIQETRLSKYVQGHGHLTDDERRRLWEVLGLGTASEDDPDAA